MNKSEKHHKVTVRFSVVLTPDERKMCLDYARSSGLDFEDATPLTILKRFFAAFGAEGLIKAKEGR